MKKLIVTLTLLLALVLPAVPHAQAVGLPCPLGAVWCHKHPITFVCLDKHGHRHRHFDPKKYHCVLF